jgi:hypothetical protein
MIPKVRKKSSAVSCNFFLLRDPQRYGVNHISFGYDIENGEFVWRHALEYEIILTAKSHKCYA